MRSRFRLPSTSEEWVRLALITLFVPTIYGLALGDADWLQAAYRSPAEAFADPLDFGFAVAAPALIVWTSVLSSHWFRFSPSFSLLATAIVCGAIFWPYVDARDFVDEIYDTYHRIRGIQVRFFQDRPGSVQEGMVLGFFCGLAWLGLEKLSAASQRGADNPA